MKPKKNKKITKTWQFRSSVDPSVHYTTILYDNGEVSCNCAEWKESVFANGKRICQHVIEAKLVPDTIKTPTTKEAAKKATAQHGESAKVADVIHRRFNLED